MTPSAAPGGDVDDADSDGQRFSVGALHLEVDGDAGTAPHRVTIDEAATEHREILFGRADQPALGLLVEKTQLAAPAGVRHSAIPRIFAAAFFAERRSFKVFCAGFFCALLGFWEPFNPISFGCALRTRVAHSPPHRLHVGRDRRFANGAIRNMTERYLWVHAGAAVLRPGCPFWRTKLLVGPVPGRTRWTMIGAWIPIAEPVGTYGSSAVPSARG